MAVPANYRLALDLGTTSIGWCLVSLSSEAEPKAVMRAGVRIFSDGRNPKDGTSLAVTRRLARQMRRRRDRLLKRKQRLLRQLVEFGFFPSDRQKRKELERGDPYQLRKKGLYEALSGEEFGRVIFHLNQRRGFRSNRKTDTKVSESSVMKNAITELEELLEREECRTVGEWLADRHAKGLSVRARLRGTKVKDRKYDFYIDRTMVAHEFDVLWQKQQSFNSDLFSQAAHDALKDTLLYQRDLLPVEPGRCSLLPDEPRAPLALPLVQRFRIYQELNHLRLIQSDLKETELSLEQRDVLAAELEKRNLTFKGIRKLLKLPAGTQFNLEDAKRKELKGNLTSINLTKNNPKSKKSIDPDWHDRTLERQQVIVEQLLNEESEKKLIDWLDVEAGINRSTGTALSNAPLVAGYGRLSRKAIERILPKLKEEVISYDKAVTAAGYASHSALSHAEQTGELMMELPYYGIPLQRHVGVGTGVADDLDEKRYGKIANPTVHVALNELRKVVNAIVRRYGHPNEIIVEVVRDLKTSKKRAQEIQREQAERQTRNEAHVEDACASLGLGPATLSRSQRRELTQKMQLWVELNPDDVTDRRCPYTGEQIGISRLLSSAVEIEHILPWSRTLDDSLNNKTVAMSRANRHKRNKTPFEAFGLSNIEGYDYDHILERAALMPRAKAKRFASDGYQRWLKEDKDFLARALNDTAYISRIAKEYLTLICPPNKVRVIPGRMTAMLRGKFGLNGILSESKDKKTRDDHRHHAVDAAVIAVTDQGLLQQFAIANSRAREKGLERLVENVPLPWPSFRDHVERAVNAIKTSHKPDHGYQGAMHEETAWGLHEDGTVSRYVLGDNQAAREKVRKKLNVIPINATGDKGRHGLDKEGSPLPYKGYVGGSNYCIEIVSDEKGRWRGEVVSTFCAYQIIREYGEGEGFKKLRSRNTSQSGKPLVMRLMKNDIVSFENGGERKLFRVVVISSAGQMSFANVNEANVDSRNRNEKDSFKYILKKSGPLQKLRCRFVKLSVLGDKNEYK